jgi:hypothetical protein
MGKEAISPPAYFELVLNSEQAKRLVGRWRRSLAEATFFIRGNWVYTISGKATQ